MPVQPYDLHPLCGMPQIIYSSNGTIVGPGPSSTARAAMLPPDCITGNAFISVPANFMPVGAALDIEGEGMVSAATANAGNFNVFPWVSTDAGVTRNTVGGANAIGVTIGVAAPCYFRGRMIQTPSGLLMSGFIKYGMQNGSTNTFQLNTTGTITASDPTVARTFGVDGNWANSNSANYTQSYSVVGKLWRH